MLTANDIDVLSIAVREQNTDRRFDLNKDDHINLADRHYWVKELKKTWFGDTNLDGEFNTSDLVAAFQSGKYEGDNQSAPWTNGD